MPGVVTFNGDAHLSDLAMSVDNHAIRLLAAARCPTTGPVPAMNASSGSALSPVGVQAWEIVLTALLGYGGVDTSYVYIPTQLTQVAGFDRMWITPLLLLFGAGLFVGNHLGGKRAMDPADVSVDTGRERDAAGRHTSAPGVPFPRHGSPHDGPGTPPPREPRVTRTTGTSIAPCRPKPPTVSRRAR